MVLTKSFIIHIIIYSVIAIVVLILILSIIRTIAQMIFIKECPRCKKRVSLVQTKMCPKCNYDFTQDSDPKHVWIVFLLIVAVVAVIATDVYTFQNHMKAYKKSNPYENVDSITTEDQNAQKQNTSSTQADTTSNKTQN